MQGVLAAAQHHARSSVKYMAAHRATPKLEDKIDGNFETIRATPPLSYCLPQLYKEPPFVQSGSRSSGSQPHATPLLLEVCLINWIQDTPSTDGCTDGHNIHIFSIYHLYSYSIQLLYYSMDIP